MQLRQICRPIGKSAETEVARFDLQTASLAPHGSSLGHTKHTVAERANHVCEYSLIHEDDTFWGRQVDHIIAANTAGQRSRPTLRGWARVMGIQTTNAVIQFTDPDAKNHPQRFYRAVAP